MSTLVESLTKDIVSRDLRAEGAALLNKWEKTGLLEGLDNDRTKNTMAVLLENQAKELLREASTMNAGDVQGFSAVAFPIVRRVFGGLIANEVVSVQPMSLPSGLIFFLDFKFSSDTTPRLGGYEADKSVYGGDVTGSQITGGVDLSGDNAEAGPYSLNNGYASPTASFEAVVALDNTNSWTANGVAVADLTEAQKKLIQWDPDLLGTTTNQIAQYTFTMPSTGDNMAANLNRDDLITIAANASTGLPGTTSTSLVRRLTSLDSTNVVRITLVRDGGNIGTATGISGSYAYADNFDSAAVGAVKGATAWPLENQTAIPEIEIKVDSVAVTALTKKLKAKWSPELGQDLNAYHNLDAEVELTSILSEQIALEIDQEILNDLIKGGTAGTLYWSRRPGKFVDREAGTQVGATTAAPDFTGTVSEWYETLVETINDVSARIHRKTLRGGANFIVCSPEIASLLEFTAGFRAAVSVDELKGGSAGPQKVGALSKKMDVYVDAYFPRNVVLVGRRGSSFLESGYVYAPYVPLQVTPTIFGIEDFVPRKGVMTRYGKKMVRGDMYGVVIVEDLIG